MKLKKLMIEIIYDEENPNTILYIEDCGNTLNADLCVDGYSAHVSLGVETADWKIVDAG